MATFIGKPCKKCGGCERYESGFRPCVTCVKKRSARVQKSQTTERVRKPQGILLMGDVFGKLTVTAYAGSGAGRGSFWLCRCECGNERTCLSSVLLRGKAVQCVPCGTAYVEDPDAPYLSLATSRGLENVIEILSKARAPLTRSELKARARMSDEKLYDCVATLLDDRRLKVGYYREERTYALAA